MEIARHRSGVTIRGQPWDKRIHFMDETALLEGNYVGQLFKEVRNKKNSFLIKTQGSKKLTRI